MPLTLADLVANRTLSAGMAALLAAATAERRSILMVAIPRNAGKTTLMSAVLDERPADVPLHELGGRHGDSLGIPDAGEPVGYLAFSEIAPHPVTDSYLWGSDVQRIFEASHARGHSIATALHADGIQSAFEVIAENGVPDEHASLIDIVVYIRSLGPWQQPKRRAVESIHEVERVSSGQVTARLIHRWDETADRFEAMDTPSLVTPEAYARHFERFTRATDAG